MKLLSADNIKQISDTRNQLAEGPFWCDKTDSLYWVDIPNCSVWNWNALTGGTRQWRFAKTVSAVFTTNTKRLAVVLKDEVVLFDPTTENTESFCRFESDITDNRANDVKVGPDGNLWIGTMHIDAQKRTGNLWKVQTDGSCERQLSNIGIANTLAWDTRRGVFYFADSAQGCIYRFPFPAFSDTRDSNPPFVKVASPAVPDGSTIDKEGCLWNAQWDGGKVVCYDSEGSTRANLELPVSRPTSCCFGGRDGTTLFVTTASMGLTSEQIKQQPLAGHVLAIETRVTGSRSLPFMIA